MKQAPWTSLFTKVWKMSLPTSTQMQTAHMKFSKLCRRDSSQSSGRKSVSLEDSTLCASTSLFLANWRYYWFVWQAHVLLVSIGECVTLTGATKNGPDYVMTHIGWCGSEETFGGIKLLGFTIGASYSPDFKRRVTM